ncbi:MAG: hypothetical protein J6K31_00075 [Parabacteroides sp.]|nr:hypothetical protein [Parabacteroides sp.]
MGTQRDIAELIVGNKGHYLLALKENQRSLYENVECAFKVNKRIFCYRTYFERYLGTVARKMFTAENRQKPTEVKKVRLQPRFLTVFGPFSARFFPNFDRTKSEEETKGIRREYEGEAYCMKC